jgi:hypothetical protein
VIIIVFSAVSTIRTKLLVNQIEPTTLGLSPVLKNLDSTRWGKRFQDFKLYRDVEDSKSSRSVTAPRAGFERTGGRLEDNIKRHKHKLKVVKINLLCIISSLVLL